MIEALRTLRRVAALGLSTALLAAPGALLAQAPPAPTELPTQGQVVAGSATISQSDARMDVTQATQRGVIDWGTFNIGSQAEVNFHQPNTSSVTLNRVLDTQASQIFGRLNANGQVFLSNPNGVYFAPSASVSVGGLVATTGTVDAAEFMAGNVRVSTGGAPGSVVNAGELRADLSGYIALLAPEVRNEGVVYAQLGVVTLAAGEAFTLNFTGNNTLAGVVVEPSALEALIENRGAIIAPGGTVVMSAKSLDSLRGGVVRNEGRVEATGLSVVNGRIVLEASHHVTQTASGMLDVSGETGGEIVVDAGGDASIAGHVLAAGSNGNGGHITLMGDRVGVFNQAVVDASGATGGGDINVGGGWQGRDDAIRNSNATVIGTGSVLRANAIESGDGGQVVVWSDGHTVFAGEVSARGGVNGGDGGAVEVSGIGSLNFTGFVDASAPNGAAGHLLLDPRDITVEAGGGAALGDVDQFSDTPGDDVTIAPSAITAVTNNGTSVTLRANNDIFINSSITTNNTLGNGGVLSFEAGRSITVSASITSDNANINFTVNDADPDVDGNNRLAGDAVFTNTSLIDAGTGTVNITMDSGGDSGAINAGQVTALNFNIAHNGPTLGQVTGRIDLGETTVNNDMSITSNSARDVVNTDGNVIVRGTTTINVGAGDVTLTRPTTDFNIIGITARDVSLVDTNAMRYAASTITGNLIGTTTGPIGYTGAVAVTGTTNLTAQNGGFGYADPYIDLTNAANNFQGGVTLSVASIGQTGTGGYATIRDANGISIDSASLARYLTVQAGGAVDLGTVTVGTDLTVTTTSGGITDSGVISVPQLTTLTAGTGNDITLDTATNNFNNFRVISSRDTTVVDQNGINFHSSSHIYRDLFVTASGDITQTNYNGSDGQSQITVDGATTFTANHGASQINLYLGSSDPFNCCNFGQANNFAGTVTLARNNGNTGFTNVQLRNTSASASVLSGLTSVGTLNNVFLRFDSAPAVTLPGMTAAALRVYAPSVANTAGVPTNLITQTGPIVISGGTIFGIASTGDIVLDNAGNNFNEFGIANNGARNVTVVDSNAINLYAAGYHQTIANNYNVTAGGHITNTGNNLIINGTATLDAGNNNITLTNGATYLNVLAVPAANNVTISERNGMTLGNVAITGSLSLTAVEGGSSLTQQVGTSVVTGSPSINTTTLATWQGGITLNQDNNVLGNLAITNAGAVNIRENDPITQASAWTFNGTNGGTNSTRHAVTLTTSDDQAITLNQAGNVFGNLTITQINSGSGDPPGAVYIRETGDTFFGMTQGGAWTVRGTTQIDSGANSINLNNGNNVFGPLQVLGGTGLTGGVASIINIHAKSNGAVAAITDVGGPGAWTAGTGADASVRLVAYNNAGTVAGGGNVNLTNAANVLGDLYVMATDATITENHSITDGPSTNWFAGNTGWVTTGDVHLIVANPTGKSITLDNLTNQLGPIALSTTGAAGTLNSVLITDNTNLTQSGAWVVGSAPVTVDARTHQLVLDSPGNVMGNLTINTSNGMPSVVTIWEDDPITQGSVWALTGVPVTLHAENNNSITLTNAANVMGNLTVTGGAVSITENDPITQGGAWTTTGTTTLNATSSAITLNNANNVLGNIAIGGTPSAVSIRENDDITQASAWVQGSTPFTLRADGFDIVLSQASNQLGDLTLTAQNATVVENHAAGITDGGAWMIPGTTTLTAGSANPIVLNANPASNFGTVAIVSASNADIADVDGIIFDESTIAGTLTVTAGGEITQIGAITAPSLRLIGTGYATLNNVDNNVQNLAAGFSGGDLEFTNDGDFAVVSIGGTSGITIAANDVTLTSVNGTITGLSNINASSSSLTLSTGTALSVPQMSIAGPQTYTASTVSGAGITLTAGVTSTASGAITFNSPVTLSADLTIQSTNSNIVFNDTVAGGTNQLIVNAGNGLADFHQAVSGLGSTGDAGAALQLTSSGATFHSTLSANNGLAITGPVVFTDNVTLANGNAASVFAGLVTLGRVGGMDLSGFDGMTFNNGVLLQNGPATINSNNSPLTFQTAGTISGPYALTLNSGTQSLTGLDRVDTNITGLTVTALNPTIPVGGVTIAGEQTYTATSGSSITLNGNVTSTAAGDITFNSPVIVGTSSTVTTVNSPVVFGSTVNGNADLTVNSGNGVKTFTGAIGGITPLGDGVGAALILQGSGATTFSSTVQARSGITAAGDVEFEDDVTLTNGDTGSTFNGLVTSGGADGNVISGFDGLAFNAGLTLVGGPVSVISNGSTISFGGAVSGAQNLTLNALAGGAGTVSGLDQIGFASDLTRLSITAQTLSLPSTGLAVAGAMEFIAAGGITLNGAVGNNAGPATGQIDFTGPVTLATGAIVIANDNAAVNFSSTVNGAQALTINNGSGTTTFSGLVGGSTPLSSLTTDATGTTAINGGGISTSGAQTYNDAVTLGATTTLAGANVQFNGTLNGAQALTINDSGATTFGGVVGGVTPLTSLITNAAGTTTINTTAITTTAGQTYNDNVTLGANVTLTGAPVIFNGTLDGAFSLNAVAGSGSFQLNGAVGGGTPLTSVTGAGNTIAVANVTTTGAQAYTAAGGITLNGDLTTDNSSVTLTGPTVLGADAVIFTGAGAGNITFSGATSTINGAHDLTLTAGTGNVVLGGVVGGITPLTAMTVSGYDLTLPGIGTVGDANQSFTALNNITLNQSRTLNAPVSFTADADNDGSGSFILLNGISLTASNNTLTITAADLDLQGSSTMSSGSGLMTIIASAGRNIALGGADAAGQMTISGGELSRMTSSGGLNLETAGAGWISVNGISAAQSQNVTGVLTLHAQGTGDVGFITSPSTFNALTANSAGGIINVGVDLNTTSDPIVFVTPVAINGASTIDSNGGSITFQSTVDVDNDLTINTDNGVLTFSDAVGSDRTLLLNLGGGSVSGLGHLQSTLTGLTVNSSSGISLPAFTISGPQVYNTGVITATGNLGGVGLTFNNVVNVVPGVGSALTFDAGSGTLAFNQLVGLNANDVTMTADEINFTHAVTGSGHLVLQPSTVGHNVAVGGSGAPIAGLNLTSADIGWLPIGTLASLTIGRSNGTGTLDFAGNLNAPNTPVTLHGGGGISQSGGVLTTGALTLRSNVGISLNNASNSFGAIAINGAPTAVSLRDSTHITQASAWVLGAANVTLNANGGAADITLTQTNNTFGTLTLTGNNVQVTEAAATDFGAISATTLTANSAGAITTSGTVTVSGLADFTTLNDGGAGITIANGSTFGSVNATARNAANNANADGDISLNLGGSTLLGALATAGDIVLHATSGSTYSQNGSSALTAAGLGLSGAGVTYNLMDGTNAIDIFAADTGSIRFRENSGFAIATVNPVGITATGNVTLSSTGTVTQSAAIVAEGLELLGAGGTFVLTHADNDVDTLAGNTGNVSFHDDDGFAIGTVNTAGLTVSGDLTLSSTGAVTQSQALAAAGLELLGAGGSFTLMHAGNAIATLAGNTGTVSIRDDSGFAIGTVNTAGLTTSGNLTLSSTGAVTQSQDIAAAGLQLLGAGGSFNFSRNTNSIPVLAGNTATITVHTADVLEIGTVTTAGITTTGNLTLLAGNAITQTQALTVAGNFTVETTHNAGDTSISNLLPSATVLGESFVGGHYTVTATGQPVSQFAGSSLQVAGNLTINSASLTLGGPSNLIGGVTTTPGVAELRAAGVITLGDINEAGDYSVISTATNRNFVGPAVNGPAITLDHAGNNIGGYIAVTTVGPAVNAGADVQTGIQQQAGTSISITGMATFTAENSSVPGSGFITLNNAGNSFGSLVLSGTTISVIEDTGSTVIGGANATVDLTLNSSGAITQTGGIVTPELALIAGGAITLTNAGNNVTTLAADTNAAFTYLDADGFSIGAVGGVTGIDTAGANLTLTAGGSGNIAQTEAITNVGVLTLMAGGSIDLDVNGVNNTIGTVGAVSAGTGIEIADSAGGLLIDGNIQSTSGDILVRTTGGTLTLADTRTITANGAGNIYLAAGAGYDFINNDSTPLTSALVLDAGRFIIYSVNNATIVKGGLTGSEFMGETYALNGPGTQGGRAGNLIIYANAATLVFTADNQSRAYGGANPVLTYTVTGYLMGDDASTSFSGTPLLATLATLASNVGDYDITIDNGTLVSLKGYVFNFVDGTLSVDPYVVDLSGARAYDGTVDIASGVLTLGALVGAETLTLSGAGAMSDKHVGNGKAVSIGTLTLNDGTNGGLASNYTLVGGTHTVDITAAALTISTSDVTKTYDGALSAVGTAVATSGTVFSGDSLSGGTFAFTNANAGAGDRVVTVSSVTVNDGNGGNNYAVTYADNTTSTIDPANITVSTSNVTRAYDGTLSAAGTAVVTAGTLYTNVSNGNTLDSLSGGTFAFTDANAGAGDRVVTVSGVTVNDGNGGNNYAVTYANNTTSTINPANITVSTSNVTRTYDGTLSAAGAAVVTAGTLYTNVSNGNTLDSLSGGTFAFTDANAGSGTKVVSVSGVTVNDGNGGNNYAVTYANNTTSTINPYAVDLSGARIYDGTVDVASGVLTLGALVGAETLTLSGAGAMGDKHVGNGKAVSIGTLTLGNGTNGGVASNYTLVGGTRTVNITPAAVTISTSNVTKTYDGTLSAIGAAVATSGQVFSGDSLSGGTFAFTDANVGAGDRVVTVSGVTVNDGNGGNNYAVTYADNTTSTINPYIVNLSGSRTYDGTSDVASSVLTLGALVGAETLTLSGTGTIADRHVGTGRAVSIGTLTLNDGSNGGLASNYTLVGGTRTADITAAPITISTSNVTRTYDGTLSAAGMAVASVGQVFGGDSLSGGTFAFTNANAGAGDRVVTVSGVTVNDGNGGNNYAVTYANNTTSTINPASITVSTSNVTKTYDGVLSAAGTAVVTAGTLYTNASNGNTLDSLSGGAFAFTDANAGSGVKVVSVSGVTLNDGNGGNNYVVTYADNTTSTITPRSITMTPVVDSRVYDGTTAATIGSYGFIGLVGSETLSATYAAAFADQHAGAGKTVNITGIALQDGANGGLAANYSIASTATATGAITPRPLTVNASVADKVYDGTIAATLLSYGLTGFVGSETVIGVSAGSAAFADKNVGQSKVVTVTGIALIDGANGGLASNYMVSSTAQSSANITPATLQVAGLIVMDKVYDGTLTANINTQAATLTGVLGMDAVQVSGISGVFDDKNVGTGKAITTSGFTLSGADAGNYVIAQPTGLTGAVTPRPLVVTGVGADRVYDGTIAATVALSDNRVSGDTLNFAYNAAFVDKHAGAGKFIVISDIALSGADAANYTVNSIASAFATVTPRNLTVAATGIDKLYDGTVNATVTLSDNRLSGDVLTLIYGDAQFADPAIGDGKPVAVTGIAATGADAGNYVMNTTAATTASIAPNPALSAGVYIPSPTSVYQPVSFTPPGIPGVAPAVSGLSSVQMVSLGVEPGAALLTGAGSGSTGMAIGGAPATGGGEASAGALEVSMVRIPSSRGSGAVSVIVPQNNPLYAQGFTVPLPALLAEVAAFEPVTITALGGGAVPNWLTYDPAAKAFTVNAPPGTVLPYGVQVTIGDQRWVFRFAESED